MSNLYALCFCIDLDQLPVIHVAVTAATTTPALSRGWSTNGELSSTCRSQGRSTIVVSRALGLDEVIEATTSAYGTTATSSCAPWNSACGA
jgi:hypothetical protein